MFTLWDTISSYILLTEFSDGEEAEDIDYAEQLRQKRLNAERAVREENFRKFERLIVNIDEILIFCISISEFLHSISPRKRIFCLYIENTKCLIEYQSSFKST